MRKQIIATLLGVCIGTAAAAQAQDAADGSDPMADLTANVIAGIKGTTEPEEAPADEENGGALQVLVQQALAQGSSDAYIEALIEEAVDAGTVEVPEALITTEGEVDTRTLLASLVSQSLGGEDASLVSRLEQEARGGALGAADGPEIYTVVAGDSLAAIALEYYGDPLAYTRIFEANRDRISNPNRISIGQRFIIPQ